MKSLLILPLLIINSLSSPVDDHSNPLSMRDESQITPKACFVDTSQYKILKPSVIGKKFIQMLLYTQVELMSAGLNVKSLKDLYDIDPSKLAMALKNSRYLHIEYDTSKLCGLKVSKNTISENFIVEYNLFSKNECATNAGNNIICNNSENNKCDMAIKCCNPNTTCTESNAFLLKSIATMGSQPIKNNNGDICTRNQNRGVSCFTLDSITEKEKKQHNSQMQSAGQLNFLLRMLYIVMIPYALAK